MHQIMKVTVSKTEDLNEELLELLSKPLTEKEFAAGSAQHLEELL